MYREKEAFFILLILFYYTLKFYAADIWYSTLVFANAYIIDSSTYLRPTFALHSRYHRTISDYPCEYHVQTDRLISCNDTF